MEGQDDLLVELPDKPQGPQGSDSSSPLKCSLPQNLQITLITVFACTTGIGGCILTLARKYPIHKEEYNPTGCVLPVSQRNVSVMT